jgi:phage gpG-like protein
MDLNQLADYLDGLADVLEKPNLAPIESKVQAVLQHDIHQNFAGAHAPDGSPWPPLKNPNKPYPHEPLMLTGNLLSAALVAAGRSVVEGTTIRLPDSSVLPAYGLYHRVIRRGKLRFPRREFYGIGPVAEQQIVELAADELAHQLEEVKV